MKKGFVTFAALLVLLGSAHATIIDQTQEQIDECRLIVCQDWLMAQTFTAGINGQLAKIDLYLENIFGTDLYPTTVSIVNVSNGTPSGSVLGQVFAENLTTGFNGINFLSESVFLAAGTQYGIILSNDDSERYTGTSTQWRSTVNDVYDGGSLWVWMADSGWVQSIQPPDESMPLETFYDKDAAFRTHMVPEPATILLLSLGLLAVRKKRE